MTQETKFDVQEILAKLAQLQADIEYIKYNMKKEDKVEAEMKAWETASEEDIINWEKENL